MLLRFLPHLFPQTLLDFDVMWRERCNEKDIWRPFSLWVRHPFVVYVAEKTSLLLTNEAECIERRSEGGEVRDKRKTRERNEKKKQRTTTNNDHTIFISIIVTDVGIKRESLCHRMLEKNKLEESRQKERLSSGIRKRLKKNKETEFFSNKRFNHCVDNFQHVISLPLIFILAVFFSLYSFSLYVSSRRVLLVSLVGSFSHFLFLCLRYFGIFFFLFLRRRKVERSNSLVVFFLCMSLRSASGVGCFVGRRKRRRSYCFLRCCYCYDCN